jgi:hypothetical protein
MAYENWEYSRALNDGENIRRAYLGYLGRAPSQEEIDAYLANSIDVPSDIKDIANSNEAQLYRLRPPDGSVPSTPAGPSGRTGQAPGGFDQTKWESDHDSMKYAAGGFLAGLTKPSEIKAMVESEAFQDRFGGATFDGKDKINFNGIESDGVPVYEVDVLMRADQAGDTSGGFWWGAGSGDSVSSPDPGDEIPDTGVSGDGDIVPSQNPLSAPVLAPPPNTFGMGPGGGGGTMGNMITPYNPLAAYSPETYVPPDPYRPPSYAAATPYQPGTYDAAVPFSRDEYVAATPFEAPTAADMAADPSYQFRLQQGQDALERSGAARGVTNTGGTLKDILDYGQNAASQEYGNVYGRMRDTYDANERNRFNAYQANYGNAMDAYGMNERNRFGAFGENERNRAGAYNTNEANRASGFDRNVRNAETAYNTNAENRYQAYTTNEMARLNENQTAEQRRAGAYNTNLNAYQNQQNYGLRAQGQQFDQDFRNWNTQWNQQRMNQNDRFNQMYQLGGAQ